MFWRRKRKEERAPASLSLETGELAFTLVRSARRSLGVQILKDGAVVVRAPRRLADSEVARFLREKSRWIERRRERLMANRKPPLRYRDGEVHPWLGESVTLKVDHGKRPLAKFRNGTIHVRVPDPTNEGEAERAVKRLFKRAAPPIFKARIATLFPPFAAFGHKVPRLKTRWMRRNFGSMSRKGVMTLNLTLLRKPVELIDYVIVHELCHLAHMNHGPRFYALLDKMLPGWKSRKSALHGEAD